jgi:hypothetical protein
MIQMALNDSFASHVQSWFYLVVSVQWNNEVLLTAVPSFIHVLELFSHKYIILIKIVVKVCG